MYGLCMCNLSNLSLFSHCSDVQGKDLQLQLDQITAKEDTTFSAMKESPRPGGKARTTRTKSRRSPYPHISHPEYAAEYPEKTYSTPVDYSPEMALQVQTAGYPGLVYATSQESVAERYGAFYPTAAAYGAHAGLYGGEGGTVAGMYSPYAHHHHHRYFDDRSPYSRASSSGGGHYDDKYYSSTGTGSGGSRADISGSGYIGTTTPTSGVGGGGMHHVGSGGGGLDSPRIVATSTESRSADPYRHTDTSASHGGHGAGAGSGGSGGTLSGHYSDCIASSGQCSRSSSREASSYPATTHPTYPTPYSNRSESSASDVDVTDADYSDTKRHKAGSSGAVSDSRSLQRHTSSSAHYDSVVVSGVVAADASRLAAANEQDKRCSYKESCSRTSTNSSSSLTNGEAKDTSIPQSVIMRRQPSGTNGGSGGGTNLVDLSPSRPTHTANTTEQCKLSTTAAVIAERKSVVAMEGAHTDSLYGNSHCAYDSYKQTPSYHNGGFHTGRTHPMMPQPGYTSVIVDAQQYHMANGYVH